MPLFRCVVTLVPPGAGPTHLEAYPTGGTIKWQTQVDLVTGWTTGTWSWTWECDTGTSMKSHSGSLEVDP